ncbi:MAG: sulfatase [Planctomycetes bacterium]|nr:sulfatase [Planctomycetota bacterium]
MNGCSQQPPRPVDYNVVVISVDTLRADHLSCYGYGRETTPNIDLLARQSLRFTNAYTTMPSTLPAHASLMSSLHPKELTLQRNGEKIPLEATLLAEILESRGYRTGAFVSSVVLDKNYHLDQGFQTDDEAGGSGVRPAEETLGKAVAWLNENREGPFFLFLHLDDPHTFYEAPEVYREKFNAPDIPLPPERSFIQNPRLFTPEKIQQSIAGYDAEIAYADWAVGELLKELDRLRLEKNSCCFCFRSRGSLG